MSEKLIVSVSPHLRGKSSTTTIMLDVIIALMPALVASVLIFGLKALLLTAICVAACVLSEFLFQFLCKRPVTIGDLSAVVTGILLAFNLPVTIPIWQAVIGSVIAIIVVKQLFGGIGMNFANPAITARIIMLIAFSGTMTTWIAPKATDLTAVATPLVSLANEEKIELMTLFLGKHGGCIGETCALALLLGGIYLVVRKVITIHTPVVFIATVFVLSFIAGGFDYAVAQILAGGLMIGAIFMATDYVTSPVTAWSKVIFGFGCGLITFVIRYWGSYPEGVSFSILFMNILVFYINNWTAKKPLGGAKVQ
jgi:electron transport complex protein RnfD